MEKLTLSQKDSLMVEMWMRENPSHDRVFNLLRQLQEEKVFFLECLVKGDNEVKRIINPQLEEVRYQISETEWYINLLTNKQDN